MRAVRIHETGSSSVLRLDLDVAVPKPKPNELQIRVKWSGVNYIDTYQRSGLYPVALPCTLGREGAGVITEIGSDLTDKFQVGQLVGFLGQGSYAEFAVCDYPNIIPLPQNAQISEDETCKLGAACLLQGLTAHYLSTSSYHINQGDWVLVHAAAGGTGALLLQIAKLLGAKFVSVLAFYLPDWVSGSSQLLVALKRLRSLVSTERIM